MLALDAKSAPSLMPRRYRVLVTGAAERDDDARLVAGLARRLGKGIAGERWMILAAGDEGFEAAALEAAATELDAAGQETARFVWTLSWSGSPALAPRAGSSRRLRAASRAEYRTRLVACADAVVAVGGGEESGAFIDAALAAGVLVVPIPLAAGAARQRFRAVLEAGGFSNESASELEMLESRPYSEGQAARVAMDVLRRQLRRRDRLGLVLEGGVAGAAQAAALHATAEFLSEHEIEADVAVGSSLGAWNLCWLLAGKASGLENWWRPGASGSSPRGAATWILGDWAPLSNKPWRRQFAAHLAPHFDRLLAHPTRWYLTRTEIDSGRLAFATNGAIATHGSIANCLDQPGVPKSAAELEDALMASLAIPGLLPFSDVHGHPCGSGSLHPDSPRRFVTAADFVPCQRLIILGASGSRDDGKSRGRSAQLARGIDLGQRAHDAATLALLPTRIERVFIEPPAEGVSAASGWARAYDAARSRLSELGW